MDSYNVEGGIGRMNVQSEKDPMGKSKEENSKCLGGLKGTGRSLDTEGFQMFVGGGGTRIRGSGANLHVLGEEKTLSSGKRGSFDWKGENPRQLEGGHCSVEGKRGDYKRENWEIARGKCKVKERLPFGGRVGKEEDSMSSH